MPTEMSTKSELRGGGILELLVEFGLFDLIGSLSACGIDGRTDGRVHRGFNQEKAEGGIHSVSGLMIHYLFFSAVSSARAPWRRTSSAWHFGSYSL